MHFLQNSCDRAQFLTRILQESCKNAIESKNLARIEFFVRILQDFPNLQDSCKILQEVLFLSTRVGNDKNFPNPSSQMKKKAC